MAKANQTSPILLAIRELRATDLAIGPELDGVGAEYDPRIAAALEEQGERVAREIRTEKQARWNEVWNKRERKYLALRNAVMAALGLNKTQFEVLLGIFANDQFDFGPDIKDI